MRDRRAVAPADPIDPHRDDLYAAEDDALPDGGRRFRTLADVDRWVRSVLEDPWWSARFPAAPVEVDVLRRSRSASFSAAHVVADATAAAIWIRDGSRNAVTVVHELAHVAVGRPTDTATDAHGPEFAAALLDLWRRHLGAHAYGALRSALRVRGVPYQGRRRDMTGR
jgi:putative metallohydrolase (TIGR04338 family)